MIAVVSAVGVGQLPNVRLSNALLLQHEKLCQLPGVESIYVTYHDRRRDKSLEIANRIAHELEPSHVFMIAHSHGWTLIRNVMLQLDEWGVEVDGAVLCDAWERDGSLVVPRNVRELYSYRQSGVISGSEIRIADPTMTNWKLDERDLPIGHMAVDEHAVKEGILWRLVTEALAE